MKKLIATVAAATALSSTVLSGVALAKMAPGHAGSKMAKSAATKTALVCPVTGNKISSVKAAVGHTTYKGKTYYFCCGMCKPKFDKNPAKYIQNAAKGKYEKM